MKKILLSLVALMATAIGANAEEPTYTAVGNTTTPYNYTYEGTEYSYSTSNTLAPSLADLKVDVYTDSIVVRNWWGAEGYDLAVTLSGGSIANIMPVVNGTPNPYYYYGYSYVDTGVSSAWIAACYNSYCYLEEDGSDRYLILGLYAYPDSGAYTNGVWGYYVIKWTDPMAAGINSVKATVSDTDAPMYNLAGQRVGENAKGLVIRNGKKIILK